MCPGEQVVYWEDDTKPDTVGKVRITGNYTAVNVSGLQGNTQYYLAVCAFNTAGTGPQSVPVNVTTKKPRESIFRHLFNEWDFTWKILVKYSLLDVRRRFNESLQSQNKNNSHTSVQGAILTIN